MTEPFSTGHWVDVLRCPVCRGAFRDSGRSSAESRDSGEDSLLCGGCGFRPDTAGKVVDLVPAERRSPERTYYDDYYRNVRVQVPADLSTLAATWTASTAPWEMQEVWSHLGDLRDKTVLLLGNGESTNELFMLSQQPRLLIYSDLSPVGLRTLRTQVSEPTQSEIVFSAIDALNLPLADNSVDVLYGFAFVHHLDDIPVFLREAARILKPGGRSVFLDDAYSPLWQHAKLNWLRPLMSYSHRKEPRSPEDLRQTLAGGFREEWLAAEIRAVGGIPWFQRAAFLYYIWRRASVSLFPELLRRVPRQDVILGILMRVDRLLGRFRWYRRNMVRLIWGFEKPSSRGDGQLRAGNDHIATRSAI